MGKQDLYVSFLSDDYKDNKAELLNTELASLNSLKHLETIRQIRREKAILKMSLKQQIESILERIKDLKDKLPEVPSERHGHHDIHEKHLVKIKEKHMQDKESDRKLQEIEKELLEINAKIRKLNS